MTSRDDVRSTYERIAAHFAKTRPEPWTEVESFLKGRSGDLGLDLGTGNGRHAELLADRSERVIAIDLSRSAIDVATARAIDHDYDLDALQADAAALPLRSDCVHLAVYIATIHHLPRRELRIQSLEELSRILSPSGTAIVSAWSVSHSRFDETEAFDTTVDWTLPNGEIVPRYYYIYDLDTFGADVEASGLTVESLYESAGNCYAVVGPTGA